MKLTRRQIKNKTKCQLYLDKLYKHFGKRGQGVIADALGMSYSTLCAHYRKDISDGKDRIPLNRVVNLIKFINDHNNKNPDNKFDLKPEILCPRFKILLKSDK